MVTPANNNYAPPKSEVADIDAENEVKASRGARLGASFIDSMILFAPLMPAYAQAIPRIAAAGATRSTIIIWGQIAATGMWFYLGFFCFLIILAINGVLAHRNGQTIGKKWLKIKDVRTDGSRASFTRIFWLRNVVNVAISMIPIIGSIYGLVDILFIFGAAKRCIHDYIADTIVVRA